MKKMASLFLALTLVLSLTLPVSAAEETSYPVLEGGVQEIQKYGNLVLDIDPAEVVTCFVSPWMGPNMKCPFAPTTPMWIPVLWCCGTARAC